MRYLFIILSFSLMLGCSNTTQKKIRKDYNLGEKANPASKKCINDGYILKSQKRGGIEIENICINEKNGKKCEEWEYYRKQCKLK